MTHNREVDDTDARIGPIIRVGAAITACLFGSLLIAMYISAWLAPPEPDWGRNVRIISAPMFVASLIWCGLLYRSWKRQGH